MMNYESHVSNKVRVGLYTATNGKHTPTCETDNPASSMSWSMEKAPVLISSWSRAAAALAESVCGYGVSQEV